MTSLLLVATFLRRASEHGGRYGRPADLAPVVVAIVMIASQPAASGQEWNQAVNSNLVHERVIGLLELDEIVGDGCGTGHPERIPLFRTPSTSGEHLGDLEYRVSDRAPDGGACSNAQLVVLMDGTPDAMQLPTEESGYEIPAAVVHQREGSWFRIALQQGSAWIERQTPAGFHQYPDLLIDHLAYIRKGWDDRLWQSPRAGRVTLAVGWRRYLADDVAVSVLRVQQVDGEAWLQVRLETERCGETLEGVTPVTGWVPAYRAQETPSLWFYSRGC